MPLPKLELETSGFDTMLEWMHQPELLGSSTLTWYQRQRSRVRILEEALFVSPSLYFDFTPSSLAAREWGC